MQDASGAHRRGDERLAFRQRGAAAPAGRAGVRFPVAARSHLRTDLSSAGFPVAGPADNCYNSKGDNFRNDRAVLPRTCGRSLMVKHQLPKLESRVRFPSPAFCYAGTLLRRSGRAFAPTAFPFAPTAGVFCDQTGPADAFAVVLRFLWLNSFTFFAISPAIFGSKSSFPAVFCCYFAIFMAEFIHVFCDFTTNFPIKAVVSG